MQNTVQDTIFKKSECKNSAVHAIRPFRDQNSQPADGLAVASDKFNYIDFRGGTPDFPAMFAPGFNVDVSDIYDPDNYYSTRVFNLTVKDYHTYFVGEWGIWVHINCPAQHL